eukprot:s10520_g1.t1
MHLTPTRHPALDLVTYLPEGDPRKQPGMLEKARLLRQAPQSLAFVAAAPATMGHDVYLQDTSEEPTEEERSADQSGTHDTGGTGVIGELPVIPDRGQEASSTASSQLQADDDDDARFSVTSHEFGVELEEEGESDEEMIPDEVFLEQGPVKFLHKEKRKKLNQAARAVQELASAGRCGTTPTTCTTTSPVKFLHKEKRKKLNQAARAVQELASAGRCGTTPTTCTTTSISRSPRARRPGPWRILEIFVCSMTVSLLAAARGWQAGQPVSLPAFDLSRSEDR